MYNFNKCMLKINYSLVEGAILQFKAFKYDPCTQTVRLTETNRVLEYTLC